MKSYAVTLTILGSTPEEVTRAAEVLGRAHAGLALDGFGGSLSIVEFEDDEEQP